jgi:PKD repeat protein
LHQSLRGAWKIAFAALGFAFLSALPVAASSPPPAQTVFLIFMESIPWSQIKGSSNAPYMNNTLLPQASYCSQYYNLHNNPGFDSEPTYLWVEAGTNFGITDDNLPSVNHQSTTNHLVTLLKSLGISWKTYQEDISGTYVPLTNTNSYVPRHNPFVFFDDVTGTNNPNYAYGIAHIRPYGELQGDLDSKTVARYIFITPDLCNDMHTSCSPLNNQVAQGDDWLSTEIPKIMASAAYSNNGVIFITWDDGNANGVPIGLIAISPMAKGGGYNSTVAYSHSCLLRTIQEMLQATPLIRDAANVTNLSELFNSSPSQPVIGTQPYSITNAIGTTNAFSVGVSGTAPLSYQWRQWSTNTLPLATNATLILANWQTWTNSFFDVVVTNASGSVTSSVAWIWITNGPSGLLAAAMIVAPTNGGAPLTVTFADTSTGTISNHFWNFGDGATTNTAGANVIHTYSFPGTNTVSLVVSGSSGSNTNIQMNLIMSTSVDTIGDGIPNWWRAQYFGGDGKTTNATSCAICDADHDGASNCAEYIADTNPTNALSCFHIQSVTYAAGFEVFYQSSASRKYTLYYTTNLTSGVWNSVSSQTNIAGSGSVDSLSDLGAGRTQRFYRIGVALP